MMVKKKYVPLITGLHVYPVLLAEVFITFWGAKMDEMGWAVGEIEGKKVERK